MSSVERSIQEFPTPPSFVEPFSGELYDRSYGAMPAHPFKGNKTKERQHTVETEMYKLFDFPPEELGVPDDFRIFFKEDYEIGERKRQMTNYENYMAWKQSGIAVPKFLKPSVKRYVTGHAEVEEIVDIALNTDSEQGFEVGRVTNPYWRRMHQVKLLRERVIETVQSRGGTLELAVMPYRSIDIAPYTVIDEDGTPRIVAFLAKYKHDIASFWKPNGQLAHLVERQIAGIRVDEASGFRQSIIENMNEVQARRDNFNWANTADERFEFQLRTTGARGFIEKAIQTDSSENFLVPESTTAYIFSEAADTQRSMASVAFRVPDADDGIAYYNSSHMS